jgi:hypothetical protein
VRRQCVAVAVAAVAGPMAAECRADTSAALGRTAVADATAWETDTGTTVGTAVPATDTATGTTDRTPTHPEGPAGDGRPRVVSGCAAVATAMAPGTVMAPGTAMIEEDGVTTVGMGTGRTVVGATSVKR